MTPLQDIDIHSDNSVFYKLHLVSPHGSSFAVPASAKLFSVEVLVYDSEFKPPYSSAIRFHEQFATAELAFEHGLKWVLGHATAYGYSCNRINNPCNCEFLSKADQSTVLNRLGISPLLQVNGV